MADDKKRLITSILHFLRSEFRSGQLSSENLEGLEVAIQCLESVYDVKETTQTEPTLLEIYQAYLVPTIKEKADASEEDKKQAEQLKVEGNTAMSEGQFYKALELYTKAIQIDPKNAVYYCNRAAAHSKLQNHNAAIVDCKIALEIDPKYSKAYGRLGLAYCGLENYVSALEYYKKAVELEPSNEGYVKNYELALEKVKANSTPSNQASAASRPPSTGENIQPMQELSLLFGNPQLLNIASQMLSDPSMQHMMSSLISNGLASTDRTTGMEELLNVGQRLAQQMHSENPHFVAELRAALNRSATEPGEQQQQQQQQQQQGATDEGEGGNTESDVQSQRSADHCEPDESTK
ncbi:hypothetical protein O3M35_004095 [Rhynocoris fuscipes]|uniref:SGTA homodimerisation domain-containing protein n=1 Tax=Rhynocoris fuscipes TaxID=488301 RepID=A0AAW1CL72_9HEMI